MITHNVDQQFQYLDQLPDSLYQKVVTLHYGSLKERVSGILMWRHHLLAGQLPEFDLLNWPEEEIRKIALRRIDGLDIIDDCKNQDNLVDELLLAVCDAIESVIRRKQQNIHGLFDNLLDRPFKKRKNKSRLDPEESDTPDVDTPSDSPTETSTGPKQDSKKPSKHTTGEHPQRDETLPEHSEFHHPELPRPELPTPEQEYSQHKQSQQNQNNEQCSTSNLPETKNPDIDNKPATFELYELETFKNSLTQRLLQISGNWRNLKEVFQSMGKLPDRGWDLSLGQLHQQGWQDIIKYRKLVKNSPQLQSIVENLGRSQKLRPGKKDAKQSEKAHTLNSHFVEQDSKTIDPMMIQGITRSDDISRMLPSEAALLGHPKLKILWHAKRAEQALLSYQAEGVLSTHIPVSEAQASNSPTIQKRPKGDEIKGPIILCIDSSGSMKGDPERIAKAISLEVVRLAGKEQRACYLYIFSGPGEILKMELEFSFYGIRQIISFLQNSFHGGTDVTETVKIACKRISEKKWRKADILLISDGLFRIDNKFENEINAIKTKYKLRIHGLLVGGWRTDDMLTICQPLYTFDNLNQ